ncbi:hypothetical protein F4801DRAFT_489785 [Xylaria longipes]|nr:hypothetical protein F4801DRAFT_489785 [Xylaria longipes]
MVPCLSLAVITAVPGCWSYQTDSSRHSSVSFRVRWASEMFLLATTRSQVLRSWTTILFSSGARLGTAATVCCLNWVPISSAACMTPSSCKVPFLLALTRARDLLLHPLQAIPRD